VLQVECAEAGALAQHLPSAPALAHCTARIAARQAFCMCAAHWLSTLRDPPLMLVERMQTLNMINAWRNLRKHPRAPQVSTPRPRFPSRVCGRHNAHMPPPAPSCTDASSGSLQQISLRTARPAGERYHTAEGHLLYGERGIVTRRHTQGRVTVRTSKGIAAIVRPPTALP